MWWGYGFLYVHICGFFFLPFKTYLVLKSVGIREIYEDIHLCTTISSRFKNYSTYLLHIYTGFKEGSTSSLHPQSWFCPLKIYGEKKIRLQWWLCIVKSIVDTLSMIYKQQRFLATSLKLEWLLILIANFGFDSKNITSLVAYFPFQNINVAYFWLVIVA